MRLIKDGIIHKVYNKASLFRVLFLGIIMIVLTLSSAGVVNGTTDNSLENPLGENDIVVVVANIVSSAINKIGLPIAVLFIVYAGLKFVLAQGNPKEIEAAQKMLGWTLAGVGVLLGASVLATIVKGTITQIGTPSTP